MTTERAARTGADVHAAAPDASGVVYAYCVVPATFQADELPRGLDAAAVRVVRMGDVAALVSTLDRARYAPERVGELTADVAWLEPRAVAHDHVVTWASDASPTIPMPMWTLFADDAGVEAALRERHDTLRKTLDTVHDAREYTVRLFVDRDALAAALPALSPAIAEVERRIGEAAPGQAYLLRRKVVGLRGTETDAVARRVAQETYDALSARSRGAVHEPAASGSEGTRAALNASFLVAQRQYDDFRRALTTIAATYRPSGVRVDFTGPWPPYHFVRAE